MAEHAICTVEVKGEPVARVPIDTEELVLWCSPSYVALASLRDWVDRRWLPTNSQADGRGFEPRFPKRVGPASSFKLPGRFHSEPSGTAGPSYGLRRLRHRLVPLLLDLDLHASRIE